MATTWRPPDDLAEDMRWAAVAVRRTVNEILTELARDWVAEQYASGRIPPRPKGLADAPVPVR